MENPLTFDIEANELEIFLQDVNEHLQEMETGLLHLEQDRAGQSTHTETMNAIFRAAHTLKAVSATIGHRRMAELTHTLETIFEALREGAAAPTVAVMDELLTTVDALKQLRDEVVTRQPSAVDVAAILERLQVLTEGASCDAVSLQSERVAKNQEKVFPEARLLTTDEMAQARDLCSKNQAILEIYITASAKSFAPGARLLQAAMGLEEVGHIITQNPTQEELVNDQHDGCLWVIFATRASTSIVEGRLNGISELASFDIHTFDPRIVAPVGPEAKPEEASLAQLSQDSDLGHEKTVRINVGRLDILMNLVGELVTDRTRLTQIESVLRIGQGQNDKAVGELSEMTAHFEQIVDQLQNEVMQARMLPIAQLFHKFPRLVRDAARTEDKQVVLAIEGEDTELDRSVIEVIGDPLIHLLRNAVSHGIETPEVRTAAGKPPTGTIWLAAAHQEGHIVITVRDDGHGVDRAQIRRVAVKRGLLSEEDAAQLDDDQSLALIFLPDLSTAEQVTRVSGRGIGLDVVQTNVRRLGGSVSVESVLGYGTTFRVTLPLTLAILQTMLVTLGDDVYALPLTSIVESLYLDDQPIGSVKGNPVIHWRNPNQALPLVPLREFFAHPRLAPPPQNGAKPAIVIVNWGRFYAGLIVDQLIGKQEVVVKSLGSIIGNAPGISGCTILGDGRVALIIDVPGLITTAMKIRRQGKAP